MKNIQFVVSNCTNKKQALTFIVEYINHLQRLNDNHLYYLLLKITLNKNTLISMFIIIGYKCEKVNDKYFSD